MDRPIAALICWELLEQAGLKGQETLVTDRDAWINDQRGASSRCRTLQAVTLAVAKCRRSWDTKQDQETWQGSWVGQWTLKSSRKMAEVVSGTTSMFSEGREGAGRSGGGCSSEWCAPKGMGQWDPDPGQPARGGAQPVSTHTRISTNR